MFRGRSRTRRRRSVPVLVACAVLALASPRAAVAAGTWAWPVIGPVVRAYDPPRSTFGSGHRGIDIACRIGAPIRAAAAGVVTFAGSVGGQRYVTVTLPDGRQVTASWVDAISVRRNEAVVAGQALATCGVGHPGSVISHVHVGVRTPDGAYLDPLTVLAPPRLTSFIRLAPR